MLFPQLPDGPVEVLPGLETTSWDAAAWFSEEERSPGPDDESWPTSKEFELLRAVRDRRRQLLATAQFIDYLHQAFRRNSEEHRNPVVDPEIRALTEQLQTFKQEITRLDEVIRENGGVIGDS
jgi:hypothetical protein